MRKKWGIVFICIIVISGRFLREKRDVFVGVVKEAVQTDENYFTWILFPCILSVSFP